MADCEVFLWMAFLLSKHTIYTVKSKATRCFEKKNIAAPYLVQRFLFEVSL